MWRWVVYVLMVRSITGEHSLQSRGKCVGGEHGECPMVPEPSPGSKANPDKGFSGE